MTTTATPRAALPLLAAAQAQKHVTHNDALLQLDALLFARFLSRNVSTPPATPADGDTYLVKATASGAWTGQNGQIAYASGGVWRFTASFTGLTAYVVDEAKLVVFNGPAGSIMPARWRCRTSRCWASTPARTRPTSSLFPHPRCSS